MYRRRGRAGSRRGRAGSHPRLSLRPEFRWEQWRCGPRQCSRELTARRCGGVVLLMLRWCDDSQWSKLSKAAIDRVAQE